MAGQGGAEPAANRDAPRRSRKDRHADHDREADHGRQCCRRVLVVVAAPFAAVLVGAWLAFGAVVRLGPTAVAWGGVVAAWLAWLGLAASSSAGFGRFTAKDAASPLIWGECFTLLVVTCTVACGALWALWAAVEPAVTRRRRNQRRACSTLLTLAATVLQAVQVAALDANVDASPSPLGGTSAAVRRLLYAACLGLPWVLWVACERLWLPATSDGLRASEHRVLARHVASPWTTRTCAVSGVHSIELGAHVRPRAADRRCSCGGEAEADVLRLLGHDATAASAARLGEREGDGDGDGDAEMGGGRGGGSGDGEAVPFVLVATPVSVARGSGVIAVRPAHTAATGTTTTTTTTTTTATRAPPSAGHAAVPVTASATESTRLTAALHGPGTGLRATRGAAKGAAAAASDAGSGSGGGGGDHSFGGGGGGGPATLGGSTASLTGVALTLTTAGDARGAAAGGRSGDVASDGPAGTGSGSGSGDAHGHGGGDGDGDGEVAVLLHGYGMGAALWCFCLDGLASSYSHVLALDWPGTGRSKRPAFDASTPEEAEAWFVQHLEAWRAAHPLLRDGRPFTLVAHSLGAVIATAYLERYPQHVRHLLLASPAGVPQPPERTATPRLLVFRLYHHVWARLSPFAIVRCMGPLAPVAVAWAVRARVAWMPEDSALARDAHLPDIAAYSFHNWCLQGSGERALSTLLLPGVWARGVPLCERLVPEAPVMRRVPLTFVYGGDFDWMTSAHGEAVCKRLRRAGAGGGAGAAGGASDAGGAAVLSAARVLNVEDGGHQLYINQPRRFCGAVRAAKAQLHADLGASWPAAARAAVP